MDRHDPDGDGPHRRRHLGAGLGLPLSGELAGALADPRQRLEPPFKRAPLIIPQAAVHAEPCPAGGRLQHQPAHLCPGIGDLPLEGFSITPTEQNLQPGLGVAPQPQPGKVLRLAADGGVSPGVDDAAGPDRRGDGE